MRFDSIFYEPIIPPPKAPIWVRWTERLAYILIIVGLALLVVLKG